MRGLKSVILPIGCCGTKAAVKENPRPGARMRTYLLWGRGFFLTLFFFQRLLQLRHFSLRQFLGDKDLSAFWAAQDFVAEFFVKIGELRIHFFKGAFALIADQFLV